jgi:hypothetical protein
MVDEKRAPQVVRMPFLGESNTEGVVARFHKKPGDSVKRDEAVLEVETDKVTIELVAPEDGVIASISAEGTTIKVGEPVYSMHPPGAGPQKAAEKQPEQGPGLTEWRQAWDVRHVQKRASQLTAAGTASGPAEAALFATALVRALAAVPVLLARVGQGQPREVALEHCEVGGEVRWSNLSIRPDELIYGALAKLKPGRRLDARVRVVRLAGAEIESASTAMSGAMTIVIGPTRTEAVVEGGAIVARPRATLTIALAEGLAAEQVQAFAAALAEQLAAV